MTAWSKPCVWPMARGRCQSRPDISEDFAAKVETGQDIALRDQEGDPLAILSISDKWVPNKAREAAKVFGADDPGPILH